MHNNDFFHSSTNPNLKYDEFTIDYKNADKHKCFIYIPLSERKGKIITCVHFQIPGYAEMISIKSSYYQSKGIYRIEYFHNNPENEQKKMLALKISVQPGSDISTKLNLIPTTPGFPASRGENIIHNQKYNKTPDRLKRDVYTFGPKQFSKELHDTISKQAALDEIQNGAINDCLNAMAEVYDGHTEGFCITL